MMRKALNMLGLCMRAGSLKSGEQLSEQLIKRGEAALAVMDSSASNRAKHDIETACAANEVPLVFVPPDALGCAIGKPGRMVAVVTDTGFARRIKELCIEEN